MDAAVVRGVAALVALCLSSSVCEAQLKRPNLVPPTQEIEILDPRVEQEGRPRAVLQPGPNGQQVAIPETVIVHKYYYTGARKFQGPLMHGGPVILVLQHPRRAERIYVPAVLPAGAPVIHYRDDGITYEYAGQRVELTFGLCGNPKLKYATGTPPVKVALNAFTSVSATTKSLIARTGAPNALKQGGTAVKNAAVNAVDLTSDAAKAAVTPVVQLARVTPIVGQLMSKPSDQLSRERFVGDDVTNSPALEGSTVRTIR